jgi:hypothetical protein
MARSLPALMRFMSMVWFPLRAMHGLFGQLPVSASHGARHGTASFPVGLISNGQDAVAQPIAEAHDEN